MTKKEDKIPTFIDQANALIDKKFDETKFIEDPRFGPGLRSFDHKVLVGVMDLQVEHVSSVLVENFREEVEHANSVLLKEFIATVAGHYDPIMAYLEKLDKSYDDIKYELTRLNLHQQKTDERISIEEEEILLINRNLAEKKVRMDELQAHMELIDIMIKPEVIHEFLEKITFVTPKLDAIIAINKPSIIRRRITKAVIISVLISALAVGLAFIIHNKIYHKTIPQTEVLKK